MVGDLIKEFFVALGFKTDEASLKNFNDGIQNAGKRAALLATAVTGVAASIGAGIVKVAEASEALGYLSEKSGASVASLEMLGYVSQQFGVSAETARASAEGLGKFLKSLPGAEGFLRSVGVATRDANGKLRDTGEMLFDLGDKIKGMPRWRQEAILGRVGVSADMIRVLTQDVGGLKDAFKSMYAVAGVDAQQAAASSREFMNELRTLKTLLGMLARAISLTFIDKMRGDMQRFRQTVVENFDKIAKVFRFIIDLVMRVAGFFGAMASRVIKWAGQLLDRFDKLEPGTKKLIATVLGLAAAWKMLNLSFLASPIGILFMLGLAIAALVDDYQGWKEGADSFIDWGKWEPEINAAIEGTKKIIEWLGQFKGTIASVIAALVGMKVVGGIFGMIVGAIKSVGTALTVLRTLLMANPIGLLVTALAVAAGLIIDNWDTVKEWFASFFSWFTEKIEWVKGAAQTVAGFFGGGEAAGTGNGPPKIPAGPALTPSEADMQLYTSSWDVNMQQQTTINVNGSDNPQATGAAIAAEQRGVNADLQRNMQTAAR